MGRKTKKGGGAATTPLRQQQQQQGVTPGSGSAARRVPNRRGLNQHVVVNNNNNNNVPVLPAEADAVEPFLYASLIVGGPRPETNSNNSHSNTNNKSFLSPPRVLLAVSDANRLDVVSREQILVLSFGSSSTTAIPHSAVLHAALLAAEIGIPHPVSSRNARTSSVVSIAPGTIRITSTFLTDHLLRSGSVSGKTTTTTSATMTATPPRDQSSIQQQPLQSQLTPAATSVATPSSASSTTNSSSSRKQSFSFKIGGGGDLLYAASTPSPRAKTSIASPLTSSSSPSWLNQHQRPVISTRKVMLIPARSVLGKQLVPILCADCHILVLEPVVRDPHHCDPIQHEATVATNNNLLLQRLVVAHTRQRHVQPHDILTISVAGRATQYRIVQCRAKTTTKTKSTTETPSSSVSDPEDTTLHEALQQLSLNEGDEGGKGRDQEENHDLQKCLHSLVTNAHCQLSTEPLLYQITHETRIEFVSPSDPTIISPPTDRSPLPLVRNQPQPTPLQPLVVGLEATLAECRALLTTPLLHPELFVHTKPPRGILLYGPSGVGKTCLARQLADEFRRLRRRMDETADSSSISINDDDDDGVAVTVEYVHCASLLSHTSVVGQAERKLTRLFHGSSSSSSSTTDDNKTRARLIILDDLHLIGAKRGSHHAGTDRLAATLLALLDGITGGGPASSSSSSSSLPRQRPRQELPPVLMVLGITRNPSLLDAALRRPGRLDVEVPVPLPDDAATRTKILQFHYGNLVACTSRGDDADADADSISESDWLELGTLAKGFNGADCVLAIKEAIRMSLPAAQHGLKVAVAASAIPTEQQPVTTLSVSMNHLRTAIRATKPTAIKSITVEIPRVLWSAIGGMDSVKAELREAIELPVTHHSFFEQLHVPPPRGILLYGPPGCSKTLMARALATEGHMNFLAVKGPELLSKWLGESERALASLFRRARMASPCIIFFDEIDAIASKRGGSSDSASSGRLLSQLLTELDGIHHPMGIVSNRNNNSARNNNGKWKDHRVVVVGATNRPDLLDPALTRPGRIDCKIYVGVPDETSRSRILELSMQDRSCDGDIDLSRLARDSQGCSGAEMVAICRDAALLALEESDCLSTAAQEMPTIAMRHLVQALQDTQRQITPAMIDFYASYRDKARVSDR